MTDREVKARKISGGRRQPLAAGAGGEIVTMKVAIYSCLLRYSGFALIASVHGVPASQ